MIISLVTYTKRFRIKRVAELFFDLYLLHELDASLQVHTEIHKDPIDTFLLVLFLLKHEHVMVEELLQLFVGEVDAKLLETVELNEHFLWSKDDT